MKIVYITNVRMPTSKAHGLQMVKMCEAFASLGVDVDFYVPNRKNPISENAFLYYGLKKNFKIHYLPTIDLIHLFQRTGFLLQETTFAISVFLRFLFTTRKDKIFYTREHYLAFLGSLLGFKVVYEAHRIPEKRRTFFYFIKRASKIITNSQGVASVLKSGGFSRVLPFPNGIDLKQFEQRITKNELREQLQLPREKTIILYAGHLYEWKGIDVLLDASMILQTKCPEAYFVFVGGTKEDLQKYQKKIEENEASNVVFLGHKNPKDMPKYMQAADILTIPNVPISDESMHYTSPVKLPEYMASGTPIIASDLPSIRALVGEDEIFFAAPGDAGAFAETIINVKNNKEDALLRLEKARKHVTEWTWENRARAIINFIGESHE